MSNPSRRYMAHMHTQTKYRATWDPTKRLSIGAIGKLEHGVLSLYTSLDKESIPVEMATGNPGAAMDYTSHEQVTITTKLSGSIPLSGSVLGQADAGFSFSFKSDNSIIFQTGNHRVHQLVNLAQIENQVLEKYNNGNWDRDWVIITELVETDATTIIISNSSNGSLELKANRNSNGPISLTDAGLGLSVAREQGSTLKYIAQNSLTPLYRVMGLKSAFLGGLSMGSRGMYAPQVFAERLELLEYDEREITDL